MFSKKEKELEAEIEYLREMLAHSSIQTANYMESSRLLSNCLKSWYLQGIICYINIFKN